MPKQPVIVPWFRRSDYNLIKEAIKTDGDVPNTYDEWLNLQTKHIAEQEARGILIKKVVVDPHESARFCKASGLKQNNATFSAFAVAKETGRNY